MKKFIFILLILILVGFTVGIAYLQYLQPTQIWAVAFVPKLCFGFIYFTFFKMIYKLIEYEKNRRNSLFRYNGKRWMDE